MAESGLKPERTIDLAHPDEIEIRRLQASSREEAEDIKAELEARGFTIIIRELGTGLDAPTLYHADIFAEKRTVHPASELARRSAGQAEEDRIKRRDYRRLHNGLVIALVIGTLLLVLAMSPLIRAVLSFF